MFSLENYLGKLSEKETSGKFYFIDNGILSLFLIQPETILLENIVAIQLKKLFNDGVYYLRKNQEVDFYIPKVQMMIQAAYNLQSPETERREVAAMLYFSKTMDIKKMLIITLDTEKEIIESGYKIEVVPVWKWLLSFQSSNSTNNTATE